MSIKARRKNLRMYNLDSDEIQGNYALMLRAAQQEAIAPSNPSIGVVQAAVCLFSFKIKDSNPNVPPLQAIASDTPANSESARKAERAGKYRIACHAMIADLDGGSITKSGLDHSSHCLPNPFTSGRSISKNDYFRLAKKFPIYVGGYVDAAGGAAEASVEVPGKIGPGTGLVVMDNDVQGGMYGTIIEQLETGLTATQFVDGPLRDLFNGAEGSVADLVSDPSNYNTSVDAASQDIEDAFEAIKDLAIYAGRVPGLTELEVTSVWRSPALQAAMHAEGKTPVKYSAHMLVDENCDPQAQAIDFVPHVEGVGRYEYGKEDQFVETFRALGGVIRELAADFPGLQWGGDFSGGPEDRRKAWEDASGGDIGWDPIHIDLIGEGAPGGKGISGAQKRQADQCTDTTDNQGDGTPDSGQE